MRDVKKILWGIVLLALGVLLALNLFGITDFDIFFPGWWTMFIILPSLAGLITDRDKSGSATGLAIGVLLLLSCLEVIDFDLCWKLGLIAIIVISGIKMIIGGLRKREYSVLNIEIDTADNECTAIFGGKTVNYDGMDFHGGEYVAVFGGVDCDLSRARIERDCRIKAVAVFGGVDIVLPRGVNAKVVSTDIFGCTDDNTVKDANAPVTVYIEAVSIFGGVDIENLE